MELDKIITGDSAIVLQSFPPDCIDLTVTSPPYDNLRTYNGFVFDFETIAKQLFRVTKVGGVVVWVVGDATINGSETLTSFKQALYFRECGFNVETMIYKKAGTGGKGSNKYYYPEFEYMFIFAKGEPITSNRLKDKRNKSYGHLNSQGKKNLLVSKTGIINKPYRTAEYGYRGNIWEYGHGNRHWDVTNHPAPFPEALARDHILSWSNPDDIVLDPMCGSGTTLKMARELGRHWIGIDISQSYCELSQRRVDGARVPLPGLV